MVNILVKLDGSWSMSLDVVSASLVPSDTTVRKCELVSSVTGFDIIVSLSLSVVPKVASVVLQQGVVVSNGVGLVDSVVGLLVHSDLVGQTGDVLNVMRSLDPKLHILVLVGFHVMCP